MRYAVSERRLAAHRHAARPDRYGATNHIMDDAERNALAATRAVRDAERAYYARRDELMASAGCNGPHGQTAAERASEDARRRVLLDRPPMGWGKSVASDAERVARWQARPETDRLSDLRVRT